MISGLPISNELLEKLKEKLNVGNLRSIQLNCIPGKSATRLDLSDIEIIDENLPNDFVDELLNHNNKFSFDISFDNLDLNIGSESEAKEKKLGLLSKRLNRLTNYNKEDLQEYGYESFGFGFPIITYRPQEAPDKVIKAPLFIWHLSVKKNLSKTNTWNISRDTDQEIEFNNLLRSYIGQISGIRIEDFSEEELLDGVLDFEELLANTIKFVTKFSNSESETLERNFTQEFKKGIKSIPQKKEVEQIATSIPNVIWGGVFGRYHLRNEAIRQEVNEKLIEVIDDEDETELLEENVDSLMHSETAALTDPSQMGILKFLKENNHLIIQGPPGTGKSESITGIILNALEHGKKCLVVCEKKTAMNVLKNNLSNIDPEIGKLVAVIDDVSRDRKQIVDSIRDRYDQQGNLRLEIPKSTNLANLVELIEEQIRDIHYRKQFLYDKNIVDSFNINGWTATVGEQLKAKLNNANDSLFETLNEALSFSERIDYLKTLDFLKRFEIETENLNYKNLLNFLSEEDLENSNPTYLKDNLVNLTVNNQ